MKLGDVELFCDPFKEKSFICLYPTYRNRFVWIIETYLNCTIGRQNSREILL